MSRDLGYEYEPMITEECLRIRIKNLSLTASLGLRRSKKRSGPKKIQRQCRRLGSRNE